MAGREREREKRQREGARRRRAASRGRRSVFHCAFGTIGTKAIIFAAPAPEVDNGSVAQWQRVGFQSRRLRVRFPSSSDTICFLFLNHPRACCFCPISRCHFQLPVSPFPPFCPRNERKTRQETTKHEGQQRRALRKCPECTAVENERSEVGVSRGGCTSGPRGG